jgi:hypothetical protein
MKVSVPILMIAGGAGVWLAAALVILRLLAIQVP